jgi:cytochrome c553
LRPPAILQAALPPPPSLSHAALEWRPEELLYIVKHGIKMTGMPAWPTQVRDDEVHAMVAFLRELPNLDAAQYRRLAHGDAESDRDVYPLEDLAATEPPPRTISAGCARCHGTRGRGRSSAAYPKLAGQHRDYLARSLEAYAIGARPSGMMQPVAAALSVEDIAKLADYYARQAPRTPQRPDRQVDPGAVERGRSIAERGIPERDVPSCVDCHDPPGPENSEVPTLHGQLDEYLLSQLELFARGVRGGSDRADLMAAVAPNMQPEQMRDVALYYSTLR